jgi:hypothetical protein
VTDRLLCAWCGQPLSAVSFVLHESTRLDECFGWHPACFEEDCLDHAAPWPTRRDAIRARGAGRIGGPTDQEDLEQDEKRRREVAQ